MPKNLFEDLDSDIIEVEDEEDATDDDMRCLNLGIKSQHLTSWKLRNEGGNAFTQKEDPTVKFFKAVLSFCNIVELRSIKKDKLPKNLQDLLDAELENRHKEIREVEDVVELGETLSNTVKLLRWLYNYMGEHTDLKEGFIPSKKDMEIIDGIEDIIKEEGE